MRPDLGTAIIVLTHDDKFDLPLLSAALASDAFYIGALGSRRNQERRRELLLEAGIAESELERISGPCGLDIGAESPAETALSMLAEVLAELGSVRALVVHEATGFASNQFAGGETGGGNVMRET